MQRKFKICHQNCPQSSISDLVKTLKSESMSCGVHVIKKPRKKTADTKSKCKAVFREKKIYPTGILLYIAVWFKTGTIQIHRFFTNKQAAGKTIDLEF